MTKLKYFVDNEGKFICNDVESPFYGRNVTIFYSKNVQFHKRLYRIFSAIVVIMIMLCSIKPIDGYNMQQLSMYKYMDTTRVPVIPEFSKEELIKYINSIDTTYRKICLAQCDWESGLGTSPLFKQTHNLFGLCVFYETEPHVTIIDKWGYKHPFKIYKNWQESVNCWYKLVSSYHDMAIMQYMSRSYCTDPQYVENLILCYRKYDDKR